jgi:hypothetical protein
MPLDFLVHPRLREIGLVQHMQHTMTSTTISHAEITESDIATWYANFDVTIHMTDKLDWFTC